ncbi:MAG: hypothetical protein JO199_02475 [Candidatus Eremiobacteraeota bacterium]|nr:hypothetical protein [Candidatus Eremiobacteraeota bacterium]
MRLAVCGTVAIIALAACSSSSSGQSTPACVTLDGEQYCKLRSQKTTYVRSTEYVRSGETLANWKKLVTIQVYPDKRDTFDGVTTSLDESLKKMGLNPVWNRADGQVHDRETDTQVVIAKGRDLEYTTFVYYQDGDEPLVGIIFSQRPPLAGGDPTQQQFLNWAVQLRRLVPPARSYSAKISIFPALTAALSSSWSRSV